MSGHGTGQGGASVSAATPAALAAGACSALCALWAMRGLPLGGLLLWVTPLPLLLAGLGFGARAAAIAVVVASLSLLLLSPLLGLAIYLFAFGLPAALLVGAAQQPGRMELALPLALLGIWPAAIVLGLAVLIPDLEGAMREAVALGTQRMGVALPEGMVEQVARVKAAAAGFWVALTMVVNGLVAQRILERRGLALHPSPPAEALRVPDWYLLLPGLALGGLLAVGGAVPLSVLLILLVPFLLLGVAAVHRRLRDRPGRMAFLVGFYLLMLLFLQVMAPLMVGLGLFEQIRRRPAPPPT
ncbi:DUF2232 domain-containing protein [Sabulicella glaciei]|uniref:DUF2232 domain-containing protein n=1 Tax=Sabulicella glaciei TaxID=2984948 RepID=A0ABT3NZH0_9PROT|nr:hypothetical protein [Roseococcus sp. MDT2-1-1]MCW8086979.1 hypothetical protein [Roseococcus sp. MDT2-1-1]